MIYTVSEVNNDKVLASKNDLYDYAKKTDVPTITDYNQLKITVGNKLDRSPQHTHTIANITDLQSNLNELTSKIDTVIAKQNEINAAVSSINAVLDNHKEVIIQLCNICGLSIVVDSNNIETDYSDIKEAP
jgi:hypothetical protein